MKFLYLVPIALAIIVFISVAILKRKLQDKKFGQKLLVAGAVCCIVAITSLFIAFYISGDKTNLYKSSVPVAMLVIAIEQIRKNRSTSN